jgi:diacylglycerol kinase (ATP)
MVIARVAPPQRILWEPPSPKSPYESRRLDLRELDGVRLGLIRNPQSGRNVRRERPLAVYDNELGLGALVRETLAADRIADVVQEFCEEGVNAIIVDGGDGTLQAAVTEAFFRYGEGNMPAFVPLHGGTYNAVAGNLGVAPKRRLALLRLLHQARRGADVALCEKRVGTVRVHDPRFARDVFGFIFMAGIPYKLDSYIYSFGRGGPGPALYSIAMMLLGGVFRTEFARKLFGDTPARVFVDGNDCGCDRIKLTMATTLHQMLPVFTPCPPPLAASQRRFSYLVNFMSTGEIYRRPVRLLMNRYQGDAKHMTGHARSLSLNSYVSGYALDGEMISGSDRLDLRISTGVPLRIWLPRPAGLLH